jgi:predicted double-glycine peptidase
MSVKPVLPMILILLASTLASLTSIESIKAGTCQVGKSAAIPEVHVNVPFYYQEKDYYCGPAALQMVFSYYGENVSQSEIANVARTIGDPLYVTYTDELRRAGQFSNASTSGGDELPENITGYTLRSLGYAAFEAQGLSLATLENFTDQGKPLILLMWYSGLHKYGHYRVVTGYNATHVFLHDPWNKPLWGGAYGGPNIAFNNSQFLDLWSYYDDWALYVSPWRLNISMPAYVKTGAPFQIESTIVYPEPPSGTLAAYPASSCNASITLPANLSLANGEVQMKKIGTGSLEAGTNSTVKWTLIADSSVTGNVNITAEGMISGSVGAHGNYSAYDYSDRIGAAVDFRIKLKVDNSLPLIGKPSRLPDANVEPGEEVKVSANVTDADSGVQNVMLFYTIDNGTTWQNRTMSLDQNTSLYEAAIRGQQGGTWVKFKILAFDRVGNNATYDGNEPYCAYQVLSEFSDFAILVLLLAATLLAVIVCRGKRLSTLTLRNDKSNV